MSKINYNGVSVTLPAGWEDGTKLVAFGPSEGPFRSNIVISSEPLTKGDSVEQFANRQILLMAENLSEFKKLKGGKATHGANSGFTTECSFTVGNQRLAQIHFYILGNKQAFLLTFTTVSEHLEKGRLAVERLFASAAVT